MTGRRVKPTRRDVMIGAVATVVGAVAYTKVHDEPSPGVIAGAASAACTVPDFLVGGATGGNASPATLEDHAGAPYGVRRTYHGSTASAVAAVLENMGAGRRQSELSFKAPAEWKAMSTGSGDAWAADLATQLAAAVKGTNHVVRLAVNHEPENDHVTKSNGAAYTTAEQDAYQRDWTAMQARLAPKFTAPGLRFGAIFMGYHQFYGSQVKRWNLTTCVPRDLPALSWLGFDIYETWGVSGSSKWRPFSTAYFPQIQAWCTANNKDWYMSETGLTEKAFDARPTWFTDTFAVGQRYGMRGFSYFNTNLNSIAGWQMVAGDSRETAWLKLVRQYR
ncbi:MAG: hypothetical protein ABI776_03695 [Nocardioidaceae bacterium]